MLRNAALVLAASFFLAAPSFAANQVITLKDGSRIKGELVAVANGVYTINTSALGSMSIHKDQIVSITEEGNAAPQAAAGSGTLQTPPQANADIDRKIQATQAQLMSNPEFIEDMQKMMQDPQITQLISDPALMQAVMAKDTNAIQNNPRAQELANNPKMKALIEKLRGSVNPDQK